MTTGGALRWGILGAAKFAREHMAPALQLAPGGSLVALATRDATKAVPFREIAPALNVHGSYDDLLADDGIDAVYIPLPNTLHEEWTVKALAAGKHVLCEKPVAMSAAGIDRLIAARDAAGKLAAEAFMIVFHPQWLLVREMLSKGAIGPLRHVDGVFAFDNREDVGNIRNQAELGGGALRDIGVYVIGSTRFVTGQEPVELRGRIRWEAGFDAFAQIDAAFPGFTYAAAVSIRLAPVQQMNFYGERGVLRVLTPFNARVAGEAVVEHARPDGTVTRHRFPREDQYVAQVTAFNAAAREGTPYGCPLEFSRGTQAMMDQVLAEAAALV